MTDNFDLRKYLAENKLTPNSKLEEQEEKSPMEKLYKQLEQTIIDQKGQYDQDTYEGVKIGLELAIAIIEQDGYFDMEEEWTKTHTYPEKKGPEYVQGDLDNANL